MKEENKMKKLALFATTVTMVIGISYSVMALPSVSYDDPDKGEPSNTPTMGENKSPKTGESDRTFLVAMAALSSAGVAGFAAKKSLKKGNE